MLVSVCKNEHSSDLECDRYRSWGECHKTPDWMLPWCRKSCMKCQGAGKITVHMYLDS